MKKNFECSKIEIIDLTREDVVTTSFSGDFVPGENEGPFVPANNG